MEIANLIVAIIAVVLTFAAGFWGVYSALAKKIDESESTASAKINRIYERMDQNKNEYYKNFILKEVHEESKKHQNELNDQKFSSLIELFKTNLLYVTNEIKAMRDELKERHK